AREARAGEAEGRREAQAGPAAEAVPAAGPGDAAAAARRRQGLAPAPGRSPRPAEPGSGGTSATRQERELSRPRGQARLPAGLEPGVALALLDELVVRRDPNRRALGSVFLARGGKSSLDFTH